MFCLCSSLIHISIQILIFQTFTNKACCFRKLLRRYIAFSIYNMQLSKVVDSHLKVYFGLFGAAAVDPSRHTSSDQMRSMLLCFESLLEDEENQVRASARQSTTLRTSVATFCNYRNEIF